MGLLSFGYAEPAEMRTVVQLAAASYEGNAAPSGWRTLTASNLRLSNSLFDGAWFEQGGVFGGAAARVMVNGNQLALSFRGTDGAIDVADYPRLLADPNSWVTGWSAYIWAFDTLLDAVADFIKDPINSISEVFVTGHSLGAAAVNQLRAVATGSSEYRNAFDSATYIAFASPSIFNNSGAILNFGHENDIVFRVTNLYGDNNSTATDNIVYFDQNYANGLTLWTSAHTLNSSGGSRPGAYVDTIDRLILAEADELSQVTQDTVILVDAVAGAVRTPYSNKAALILGEVGVADELIGGSGADILVGFGGNDKLTGGAGNDLFRFVDDARTYGSTTRIVDLAKGDVIEFDDVNIRSLSIGSGDSLDIGQLALRDNAVGTVLQFGMNSSRGADLTIQLTGYWDLSDFTVSGDRLTVTGASSTTSMFGI